MRDYKNEFENRVYYIKKLLATANANGVVFGNSGGKDSALVGILCKSACENTIGVILPCEISRNFDSDVKDALALAKQFNIETRQVDLTKVKIEMKEAVSKVAKMNDQSVINLAPRIRMTTLYAISACENLLVAGTGNRSERYVGYFTKWGDGAQDFNPISDLTATEVLEFLRFLNAPLSIVEKAPSAGLKEEQTDEKEMGVTYEVLDRYITTGKCDDENAKAKIDKMHAVSLHKREGISVYNKIDE